MSAQLPDLARLSGDDLRGYVLQRRWFGSKTREVSSLDVLAAPVARTLSPALAVALVETRFQAGTHEIYQVPLGLRPAAEGWGEGVIGELDGWTVYDAATDPMLSRELVSLMRQGHVRGRVTALGGPPQPDGGALDADASTVGMDAAVGGNP